MRLDVRMFNHLLNWLATKSQIYSYLARLSQRLVAENSLLESSLQKSQDDLTNLRVSVVNGLSGSCEEHSGLDYGEFMVRGGRECPVCQQERIEKLTEKR